MASLSIGSQYKPEAINYALMKGFSFISIIKFSIMSKIEISAEH